VKTLKKTLQVIVIAGLISLLPISAIAGGLWPFPPGNGGRPGRGGGGPGHGGGTGVPEPSTLVLLAAAGVGGIVILKRYRKDK
jgi:hypothetical protein